MASTEKIYELFNQFPNISTDSRKIEENSLFFALKGENFNGNQYAGDAIDKGASFAIIDEKKYSIPGKTILVSNVMEMLQKLALFHRRRLNIPILAITGSNGKTTTKELISAVLSQKFNISFTKGNLNNHIGVPLTLLSMNSETEFGIVEMGANHPGEIAFLCSITEPDFGIITNIGKAHLEGFGSFEGVKKAKAELYDYLANKNGTIFRNKNNPVLEELSAGNKKVVTYGTKEADFIGGLIDSPPFIHVKATFPKGVLYLNTKLIGNYNFENILAAACIGNYFKVDPLKVQKALRGYEPANNRSQFIKKGDISITLDAYNANPTSMEASVKSFVNIASGKKFLILGDMLELGEYADNEHLKILELVKSIEHVTLFLVGKSFRKAAKNFPVKSFENVDEICAYFKKNKIKNGNILIKGSRAIQLEKVLDYIN